ncbi:hypothetical protein RN51_03322 [Microbacterium oxydans]|uniref:Uncharacterized protein n=1 Tax=Microbacterium oxydans TaxID=82380 RepID=A0A0F0KC78_9MICO|nr:hypothetical protein [Microbacterium oxydans]KJL18488.1 hypothetical protein RN51_03322 [Microbacterium oxydans]
MEINLFHIAEAMPANRIPKTVQEATKFAEYAATVAARLAERPTIDTSTITTSKDLDAALEAAQTLPAHDEQAAIARQVAAQAEAGIDHAWFISLATDVDPAFAELFNAAAERFTTAATAAGDQADHYLENHYDPAGAALRQSINELDVLREHRDRLASLNGQARIDVWTTRYTPHSRVLWVKDRDQWQDYIARVTNGEPWQLAAHRAGVTIKWQTLEEQKAQPIPAAIAKAKALTTNA